MQARDARDTETDEALMLAWQAGDAAAFDRIYERHRGGVFRYLLRHCRDRATAEELHQDVWLKLVAARATFRRSRPLYDLALFGGAQSHDRSLAHESGTTATSRSTTMANEHRLSKHRSRMSLPPATRSGAASALQEGALLVAALEALPAAQRDAFLLHVEAGLAVC